MDTYELVSDNYGFCKNFPNNQLCDLAQIT